MRGDASQVEQLLNEIDRTISQFRADGAYDGEPTCDAVGRHSADAVVVTPPRSNAIDSSQTGIASQRDRHIEAINAHGRMKWQATTGYGKRSLVETAIGRYKSIIGHRLRARSFGVQQTEVAIGCAALNRMLACASPNSVRCQAGKTIASASKTESRFPCEPCTDAVIGPSLESRCSANYL
jgi:hypothetical protein